MSLGKKNLGILASKLLALGLISGMATESFSVTGKKDVHANTKVQLLFDVLSHERAESEITLRRIKSGFISEEQSGVFLRKVESLRKKFGSN